MYFKLTEAEVKSLKPRGNRVIVKVTPFEKVASDVLVGVKERYPSIMKGAVVKRGDLVFELEEGDEVLLPVRIFNERADQDPVYVIIPEVDLLGKEEE